MSATGPVFTKLVVPEYVSIFPEMGQAALRRHDEDVFATWALVHSSDAVSNSGKGLCDRADVGTVIRTGMGVGLRQAQRLMREGEGRYWRSIDGERLLLFGQAAVGRALDLTMVTRAHHVPVGEFVGRGRRRAALVALSYRTDSLGHPTSRRLVSELTGVPATTQRRLDREHGLAKLVTTVFADLGEQPTQWYSDRVAEEYRHWGFVSGWGAKLYRQHGSIRSASTHHIGSSAAMRRLNHALKAGRPAISSRGPRAYFEGEKAVQSWMRDKRARGKRGSGAHSLHPLLNYSLVVGSPGAKRHHTSVLSEIRGASQLTGGLLHRRGAARMP